MTEEKKNAEDFSKKQRALNDKFIDKFNELENRVREIEIAHFKTPDLSRVYVEFEYLRQQFEKLVEGVGVQADALDSVVEVVEYIVKKEKGD